MRSTLMTPQRSFVTKLSTLLLLLLALFPGTVRAYEAGLVFPATGSWNGFNRHLVVAECLNVGPAPVAMAIEVYRSSGALVATRQFVIPSFGTTHNILNEFRDAAGAGVTNDHGTFILRLVNDNGTAPVISCISAHYRMRSGSSTPEYAFAIPVTNGNIGTVAGIYNSMDAGAPWNIGNQVATENWLSIINTDLEPLNAAVEIYDGNGQLSNTVYVGLAPSARADVPLGFQDGQRTGIYRIVSESGVGYASFVTRYHSRDGRNYNFALYTQSVAGGCNLELPASSMNGPVGRTATNWLELGNPTGDDTLVHIDVKNSLGAVVHSESRIVPKFGQSNMLLNPHIDPAGTGNVGSVTIACDDPDEKLVLQTAFYGNPIIAAAEMPMVEAAFGEPLPASSTEIGWAYISQAVLGPGASNGEALVGGANTFLNAYNWEKLVNGGQATGLAAKVYNGVGTLLGGVNTAVSEGGTFDFGAHEYLPQNNIGVVVTSTATDGGNASVKGELVRVFIDSTGNVAEVMPTPLIAVKVNSDGSFSAIFTGETSLAPYRDQLSTEEARHLLTRLNLGYSSGELDFAMQNGLRATVSRLMDGAGSNRASCLADAQAAAERWKGRYCRTINSQNHCRTNREEWNVDAIGVVRLHMMINCPWNGFVENMGTFWDDHFGVSVAKDQGSDYQHFIWEWYKMTLGQVEDSDPADPFLRSTDWGSFLQSVTKTGSMLSWLNLFNNTYVLPNEDFARELQELYSLGEADPFTETDRYNDSTEVASIARVMTGLSYTRRENQFGQPLSVCLPNSNGDYVNSCQITSRPFFLTAFDSGRWMPDPARPVKIRVYAGRPYEAFDSFDFLSFIEYMVASHPAVPNYLAESIIGHWVIPKFSANIRNELAALIRANDFKLGTAIRTAVQSKAFFSPSSVDRKCVKWPVEVFVPLFKTLGFPLVYHQYQDSNGNNQSVDTYRRLAEALTDTGMRLFQSGTVFGFGALPGRCGDHRAGKTSFGEGFLNGILETQRNLIQTVGELDRLYEVTKNNPGGPLWSWRKLLPNGDNSTPEQTVEHILTLLNLSHRYSNAEKAELTYYLTHVQTRNTENANVFFVGWEPRQAGFEEYVSIKIPNLIQILVLDERYYTTG